MKEILIKGAYPLKYGFDTMAIHSGQQLDSQTYSRALPIYQTTAYGFEDQQHAQDLFELKAPGNIYSRISNPTQQTLEERVAALDGGVGALAFASGHAAICAVMLNLAACGDNIVSSDKIYGGAINLLGPTFAGMGITTTFVDTNDLTAWEAATDDRTKAYFVEGIGNPNANVADIEKLAELAHRHGIPLIVDSTFTTPYLQRPIEFGADIVVHSATKYLGGHGTSIAGAIVDSGNFDFASQPERFPLYNTPDESYHGLVYARDLGVGGALGANLAFLLRIQTLINRDLGTVTSPFNAFLISQGIETLSLRIERHVSNALAVARFLEAHPDVESVNYAGLESSPYYELGKKYAPLGTGGLLSFVIKGGYEAGRAFADGVQLLPVVANIGDAKSLVIHPASTTHSQLTEEELAKAGVAPGTVRLSIGLENIKDILADLQLGFDAARAATA